MLLESKQSYEFTHRIGIRIPHTTENVSSELILFRCQRGKVRRISFYFFYPFLTNQTHFTKNDLITADILMYRGDLLNT